MYKKDSFNIFTTNCVLDSWGILHDIHCWFHYVFEKKKLSSTCMFMWVFSHEWILTTGILRLVVTRCAYLNDIILDKKVRFSGWYIRQICDNGFEYATISCNVIGPLNKDLPLRTLYHVSTCTYREYSQYNINQYWILTVILQYTFLCCVMG